jgi:SAM-dependent methyltransferase
VEIIVDAHRRRRCRFRFDNGLASCAGGDQHRRVQFDFEETFGEDYLYFYDSQLTEEQSDRDTDEIVSLLGLHAADAVLDAPCGHGRISIRLAERGVNVVGVDASAPFLQVARQAGANVDYRLGDLRELPVDGPFDAVISWFTSFGYFDDDGNRQVLAEYHRVLRPGGRLLLETQNHDELVRRFTPAPFSRTVQIGDDMMIDTNEFDCLTGRLKADRVVVRDGNVRRSQFFVRLPTIPELRAWLADAGFAASEFCARDGGPPAIDRPRLVVLATA